ncbi:MAG: Hint domain-containing protein [Sphingomicrobium sp.]
MARLSSAARRKHEADLAAAFAQVLAREAGRVAERLRHRALTSKALAADASAEDDWWDEARAADETDHVLRPAISAAAVASAGAVAGHYGATYHPGADFDASVTGAADLAASRTTTTTRQAFADLIDGAEDDEDAADAIDRYAGLPGRADLVGMMEIGGALALGGLAALDWLASRPDETRVAAKTWVLSADHEAPDECDDNDGMTIALDDDFPGGEPGEIHMSCSCESDFTLETSESLSASASTLRSMADTATLDAPPAPEPEAVASPERVRIPGATMARAVALLAAKGITVNMGALTAAADGSVEVGGGGAWHAVLTVEGIRSSDGREFAPGAVNTRALPLPLMCLDETSHGSGQPAGAYLAGAIQTAERDGARIMGTGVFDQSDDGAKAQGLVDRQMLRFVSVDAEVLAYELVMDDGGEADIMDIMFGGGNVTERYTEANLMGACYSADTEVLTDSGWKTFDKIERGVDRMATRNQKTAAFEWQEPVYYHEEDVDGSLIHFTSRGLDLMVTANHRMLVRRRATGVESFVPASDLAAFRGINHSIPMVSTWHDDDLETFRLVDHGKRRGNFKALDIGGDDFASFMGMWLAEGCVNTKRGQVYVSQIEGGRGFEMYRPVLDRISGRRVNHTSGSFTFLHRALVDYLAPLGHAAEKYIPDEVKDLSRRQLRLFWDAYMAGDGDANGRKAYTSSKRLAGDLQEVAQKIGLWVTIGTRRDRGDITMGDGRIIKAENQQQGYVLGIHNAGPKGAKGVSNWRTENVDYTGKVYCVSVPNESLYVRRNGKPAWCGNTICAFPAFPQAVITMANVPLPETSADTAGQMSPDGPLAVAAGAGWATSADAPPAEWFTNPELGGPTHLTVTAEGRVFGHVATWGQAHVGYTGKQVFAPKSKASYAYYCTGVTTTAAPPAEFDGVSTGVPTSLDVRTGPIVLGTSHAGPLASHPEAMAHYDNTGHALADVACGEDAHGIWVAGAVRATATDDQIRVLRASDVSGDWRAIGGNLEMVGVLTVNAPGFPIPRSLAASAAAMVPDDGRLRVGLDHGQPVSLVAAGILRSGPLDTVAKLARKVAELDAVVSALKPQALAAAAARLSA